MPFFREYHTRILELHAEIQKILETLPPEALEWTPAPEMSTITVLVTHLTGAERFLIGDIIMETPTGRDRSAEFSARGASPADLIARLRLAEQDLERWLGTLKLEDLEKSHLHPRHGKQVSASFALLHALEHASEHLGHIQLTAQLWVQRQVV